MLWQKEPLIKIDVFNMMYYLRTLQKVLATHLIPSPKMTLDIAIWCLHKIIAYSSECHLLLVPLEIKLAIVITVKH